MNRGEGQWLSAEILYFTSFDMLAVIGHDRFLAFQWGSRVAVCMQLTHVQNETLRHR